jgi:hypothetical protein
MKVTRRQLTRLIREEIETLSESLHQYTVGQLEELMQEAGADGRVIIQLDGAGEPLEIFEAYESGGNVYLSVERKR